MKETLEYYYGIDVNTIDEQDGKYHFKLNNEDFFFVYYNRGIDELDDIIGVNNEMIKKGHQKSQLLPINQTEALDFMSGVPLYSSRPSKAPLDQSKRRMPFIEFKNLKFCIYF